MNTLRKSFTLILVFLMLSCTATQVAFVGTSQITTAPVSNNTLADSVLVVENSTINYNQAFNDDDFQFYVYNGTLEIALANVTLYNVTDDTQYDSKLTVGDGSAVFYNVPVGVYEWNVTWAVAGLSQNGTMVSDGPDVYVDLEIGNLDWANDDDDFLATVVDIDNNPAEGLNFTIFSRDTNTTYDQIILGPDGVANFTDIPVGNYSYYIVVQSGDYAGVAITIENFTTDGTTKKVFIRPLGNFAGDPGYYDLEVFTYYETSLAPLEGALVNVTRYNGTELYHQYTPANGTVRFLDLPALFINWTVTYSGIPIGAGSYSYNLTTESTDIRVPNIMTTDLEVEYYYETENITITWDIQDEYPSEIRMYVDDSLNETVAWTNQTTYTFNATGFEIGVYELKLVLTDQNSNTNESVVSLRIYEDVIPVMETPDDLEFYFTETGQSLRWNLTDDYLDSYILYRDNDAIDNGTLDQAEPYYSTAITGLDIGVYLYSLWINDTSGNSAFGNVTVTVKADDVAPVFTYEPSDVYYARGDNNIVRNWTVTDDFKSNYTITIDGIVVVQEDWISETIEFDFWGLSEGTHEVILTVTDLGGNTASSTVMVYVSPPLANLLILVTLGITGVLILLGIVIWYFKYR
ncbi:MAG: hypothetical protein ACFFF4_10680 [Candidatus Thorarchaeota archaeon]